MKADVGIMHGILALGIWAAVCAGQAGALTGGDFIDGQLDLTQVPPPEPGDLVGAFVYDGLGRLVAKEARVDATCAPGDPPPPTCVAVEDYYYDGVRRVQEVEYYDPDTALYLGLVTGDPLEVYRERDYVYGPGYVDEFVCQVDEAGDPVYYVQDANYNVVALVDGDPSSPTFGAVLLQYAYTPYGQVLVAEDLTGGVPPTNRVGHQGLFFERFFIEPGSTVLDPALTPNAAGLYYNRNRWYSPQLGRFISLDPNESASPIITALVMNGEALDTLFGAFNPGGHFGDGMNLYEYLGSNPVNRLDAAGLDWWDDEIDDAIFGIGGDRIAGMAALAAKVGMFTNTALLVGQMALSFMPGGDATLLIVALAQGKNVTWEDVLYAGLDFGGPLAKIAGTVAGALGSYKLGKRAWSWIRAGMRGMRRFDHKKVLKTAAHVVARGGQTRAAKKAEQHSALFGFAGGTQMRTALGGHGGVHKFAMERIETALQCGTSRMTANGKNFDVLTNAGYGIRIRASNSQFVTFLTP